MKLSLFYLLAFFGLVSCGSKTTPVEASAGTGDVFYASGFKIYEFDSTYSLTIGNDRFDFTKGEKSPKYFISSTTQLQFIKALNELDNIVGVFDAGYFKDSLLNKKISEGKIINCKHSSNPDWESLIKFPDATVYGSSHFDMNKSMAKKLNIRLIQINEYEEVSPLAKAEWIKVFGLISGKVHLADSIFKTIEQKYLNVKAIVSDSVSAPKVMAGEYYDGIWTVPGARSYVATLIKDAGGDYIVKESTKPVLMMDKEAFFSYLRKAHFWRKVSPENWQIQKITKDEINSTFGVYPEKLKSIIYCDLSKVNYFESSLLNPDIELKDMINSIHSVDSLKFYKIIPVE